MIKPKRMKRDMNTPDTAAELQRKWYTKNAIGPTATGTDDKMENLIRE